MPGKVNPVVPEAVAQVAMAVFGYDQMIVQAASAGNLELNQFLPLVADSILTMLDLLAHACDVFARQCVDGHRGRPRALPAARPQQYGHLDRAGAADRLRQSGTACRALAADPRRHDADLAAIRHRTGLADGC